MPSTAETDDEEAILPDPKFIDPDPSHLSAEDVLYYQILMVGLGIGAILMGFDTFYPGMTTLAKLVFVFTIALAIMIKWLVSRREERALIAKMEAKTSKDKEESLEQKTASGSIEGETDLVEIPHQNGHKGNP